MAIDTKAIKKIIQNHSHKTLVRESFEFAKRAYKEKERISKENYLDHVVRVASFIDQMGLDSITIATAFLHDVLDELPPSVKKIELGEIKKHFGEEVAFLVERISELGKIRYSLEIRLKEKSKFTKEKLENLRKMFFAEAQDLRVILIELISRLDNLRYLNYLPSEQQKIYALETLKIFVPVAEKLGIWEIKSQLEDLSFSYLLPERFAWLKSYVKTEYEERKRYLKSFAKHLQKILKKERIVVSDINWRSKSYWSTYKKLLKKNMDIEKVHDLLALRIIVGDIESCYKTIGIIHKYYKPLTEEIDDYITKPKPNGYRSLHTTVFCEKGQITEIQIRTSEMHKEAEYGICAHWAYKEDVDLEKDKEDLRLTKEVPEFWQTFKIDFYENQIFTFTPRGDVIVLLKGSTPIDFAYAVHSDIGNHCKTAKVNRKIVNLSHPLKNGDIVEIIVNKKRSPSPHWLSFVKGNLATSHIKKELAKKTLINKVASLGKIPSFVKRKVFEVSEIIAKKAAPPVKPEKPKKEKALEIYLAGEKGILVNRAKCCNPEPGDDVVAYISKYRAAVLHKPSCKNFKKLSVKSPERIMEASWGKD